MSFQNLQGISGTTGGLNFPGIYGTLGIASQMSSAGTQGFTGMSGDFSEACIICKSLAPIMTRVDINLKQAQTYLICSKCLRESRKLVKKLKKIPLEEIPLHINDENIFVKEIVRKRLEGC